MKTPKIVTNKHPRELLALHEIPAEKQSDFDYIDKEERFSPRLFKYRDEYYDIGDIMRVDPEVFGEYWHAALYETYFSGILIHVCDNNEAVIIGHYFS
jgi:hypothetical protein